MNMRNSHSSIRAYLYLCIILYIAPSIAAKANFRFASYYGNHMVLQRSPLRSVIWGYGPGLGETVTLIIPGVVELRTQVTHGPAGLIWSFTLPEIRDSGPYSVKVQWTSETITMRDVLFGDVWICSGQSNMEFSMGGVFDSSTEIEKSVQYKEIRMFKASKVESFSPLYDLHKVDIPWTQPNNDSVFHFSAVCLYYAMGIYETLKRPLGLVEAAWGGTPIEAWSSPESLTKCGSTLHLQTKQPMTVEGPHVGSPSHVPTAHCVLWNSMIHPLLNLTIYGVIWYQGESNAGMARFYRCAFRELIADWRRQFSQSNHQTKPTFPFGFVQIGAYRPGEIISGFCSLRWMQTQAVGYVPNPLMKRVFMAVAMDLPDFQCPFGEIHPRNKRDVGWRLSRAGLAVAYGLSHILYQGPFPIRISSFEFMIRIDYGGEALDIKSNIGFEICCSTRPSSDRACSDYDPSWISALIINQSPSLLTLDTAGCGSVPVTLIRYAWRESPCDPKSCAVYGEKSHLPAPPFILPSDYAMETNCESNMLDNEESCFDLRWKTSPTTHGEKYADVNLISD